MEEQGERIAQASLKLETPRARQGSPFAGETQRESNEIQRDPTLSKQCLAKVQTKRHLVQRKTGVADG